MTHTGCDVVDHPVHMLEARRCEAFARNDLEAAAELLSDDLVYVHAPGLVHAKAELLSFLGTGLKCDLLRRRHLVVRAGGDIAWTTGLMKLQGTRLPGGEPVDAVSFATQVWTRQEGVWRLSLLQSTQLPYAAWTGD